MDTGGISRKRKYEFQCDGGGEKKRAYYHQPSPIVGQKRGMLSSLPNDNVTGKRQCREMDMLTTELERIRVELMASKDCIARLVDRALRDQSEINELKNMVFALRTHLAVAVN